MRSAAKYAIKQAVGVFMSEGNKKNGIGLVLEGGAMRGMFTAGVLDVFTDNGIFPDAAVGVSAGALFGVNYIAGQRGRVIRYSKRFNGDKRYMGIASLLKTGNIVNTEFAYGTVPKELDIFDEEAYEKRSIPFYAVITNIETGNPEYVLIKNVFDQMDVLRASAAMPFVSKPVELAGRLFLDGGISDSIPFEKMASLGYEKTVVILTQPAGYVKSPMSPILIKLFYRKRKALCRTMINRSCVYNESIKKIEMLEAAGEIFVIRPPEAITIGRIEKDPEKLQAVYEMGIKTGTDILPELLDFLG